MSRVGGDRTDLMLLAVDREGVEPGIRHPEGVVPGLPDRGRPTEQAGSCRRIAERDFQLREPLQSEDVERLLFDGRDRRVDPTAVVMTDRLVRVLPGLVGESPGRATRVLDEVISIEIAVSRRPRQRSTSDVEVAADCDVVAG